MNRIKTIILIAIMLCSFDVFADDSCYKNGIVNLGTDECIITTEYNSVKKENNDIAWIPLRSALEGIGSIVTWDGDDRKINIMYNEMEYIATLDVSNIDGYIEICKSKYVDYNITDLSLQMSPWGGGGAYKIINDRIYLDDCAVMRLFNYFGYYICIDHNNQKFQIVQKNEETDKIYNELYENYCTSQPVDNEIECLTLDVWCGYEYSYQYGIFDVINCSSERLENDDLIVAFEFRYNDKELENELYDEEKWEFVNDVDMLVKFNGEKIYKRKRNEDMLYNYYVIQCDKYYVGYSVVPSFFLKISGDV